MTDIPASAFLVSQRLWYRAPELADAERVTAWRNDPRIRRTILARFPVSLEAARKYIEDKNPFQRGQANDHALFMFGVIGTTEPLGNTGVFAIDWVNRRAEFGIYVDPAHWNRGYAREAACAMLRYAFHELNLHRVHLHVLAGNLAAIKAYRAAGFILEGTLRQADCVDGAWQDVLLMAALSDEWQEGTSTVSDGN